MVKSIEDYVGKKVTLVCQDWLLVEGTLDAVEKDFIHVSGASLTFSNQPVFSNRMVDEISLNIGEVVCILKGGEFVRKPSSDGSIQ